MEFLSTLLCRSIKTPWIHLGWISSVEVLWSWMSYGVIWLSTKSFCPIDIEELDSDSGTVTASAYILG